MKKLIFILLSAATSCFAATPTWDTITINQAIAGVWSSTATTIASGTLVLPRLIPDGTIEGIAALIQGGNVSDANWSHLVITDTDKSVGRGGSISFGTGSEPLIDPFASIKAIAEGDYFGSLGFFTRPDGGTCTQNMTILSNGSIGVGTTTVLNPGTIKFEVFGGAYLGNTAGSQGILFNDSTGDVFTMTAIDPGFNSYIPLRIAAGNFDQLYLAPSGNVGIGTASPAYTLDVTGNTNINALRVSGENGGVYTGAGLEMGYLSGQYCFFQAYDRDNSLYLPIEVAGSVISFIANDGLVGVGTTSPTCTFEVSGGAQATSFRGMGNYGGAYVGGAGIEIGFSGGGFVLAYDRDINEYQPVEVSGSQASLTAVGGSANIVVSGTGVTMGLQQLVRAIYPLSPTTGFTVNAPADYADQTHYLTPAATIAAGSFIIPTAANSVEGQFIRVFTNHNITAFTFTVAGGGTIIGDSTGVLAANKTATFQRVSNGAGQWIRIKE